jgi:hypothetical protein
MRPRSPLTRTSLEQAFRALDGRLTSPLTLVVGGGTAMMLAHAAGERFFLGTRSFAGQLARRDVEESLAEYRRWGYFSREEPIAKELGGAAHGTLGPRERMNLLRRLVERKGSVALQDYLSALRGRASRRQASRDLATASFLRRVGATRGAAYVFAASPGATPASR